MTLNPAQPPAHPPEQLQRIKNLIYMLPGVSGTGFIKSDGRWALKVWPKEGEELLKPVIEALSDGHTVIYAAEPLEMKGAPLPPRPVRERCWNWAKERPAVAVLLACLMVAVITIGELSWQWRAAVSSRDLSQRRLREQALLYYKTLVEIIKDIEKEPDHSRSMKIYLAYAYLLWGESAAAIDRNEEAEKALLEAVREYKELGDSSKSTEEVQKRLDQALQALKKLRSHSSL